jgi:hypothetical protein
MFGRRIQILCGYNGIVDATILSTWMDKIAYVMYDDGTTGFITATDIA